MASPAISRLACQLHVFSPASPCRNFQLMGEQFISVIRPSLIEAHQWDDGAEAAWRKLFQVSDVRSCGSTLLDDPCCIDACEPPLAPA